MNFNQTISDYLEHLGHRGYSQRTIEAHREHLRKFAAFIERFYPRITTFETVTKDIAEDYQRYVADLKNDRGQVISNATKLTLKQPEDHQSLTMTQVLPDIKLWFSQT